MKHVPTPSSKTAKVLAYLQTGHSLDISKATALWGHMRLSDTVFRLRAKGYPIQTEVVQSESSDVQFAIYRLPRMPSKDTPVGTKVRVLPDVDCAGSVGIVTVADDGDVEMPMHVTFADDEDAVCFDYNELEIIQ
jgi:hypothetical protein